MLHKQRKISLYGKVTVIVMTAGFILQAFQVQAQKVTTVNIEHADLLKIEKANGKSLRILSGNAILRQDSTYFYCDTASLDENNDLRAVGHVHISYSDSVDLYGDNLVYSGNSRIAVLDSNVRLIDKRATLYTDHLEYDRNRAEAYYPESGRIVDEKNVLTSKKGRYFTQTYEFVFSDSVVLVNPDYKMYADTLRYNTGSEIVYIEGPTNIYGKGDHIYSEKGWYDTKVNQAELNRHNRVRHLQQILKGDSIYYDREREYGKAIGHVWLKDTAQNVILEGAISEFDRAKKFSYMTGNARAILVEELDSIYMHADSFILEIDTADKARYLFAYHRMKFFRNDLQGMSDSLVFRVQDSVIALLKNPVLWSDENQLVADSIWMYVSKNRIDSMVLYNMAFIVSHDSNDAYNQIRGRQMRAYFRKNQLYSIKVLGNAETVYYVRDENNNLIGINKAVSSNMVIMLWNRKIKKIYYMTQPEATLYPEKDLPKEEQFLKDFKWITGQRPMNRNDIYIWEEAGSKN